MTTRYPYWVIVAVCVEICFQTTITWAQDTDTIDQANHLYSQNRYSEAAKLYEQVISNGRKNGHLHYNLGNTYFRMENYPKAILHYIKAQNLLPRNEDVEANLKHAIRQTEDHLGPQSPQGWAELFFWVQDFNLNEHMVCLFWVNLIFWVLMAINLQHKTIALSTLEYTRNLVLVFLVLVSISTGFRWRLETRSTTGVILPRQVGVHSGWSDSTPVLFQLHQGTVVSISQEKDNWYEIELPDEEKGWLIKTSVAR